MAQHFRLIRHVAAHAQQVVIFSVWAALVAAVPDRSVIVIGLHLAH